MQDSAGHNTPGRYMRSTEDWLPNSEGDGEAWAHVSLHNDAFLPQASIRQLGGPPSYPSSDRNDDGVSALTADEFPTTTLHEPGGLGNSPSPQTRGPASQSLPVKQDGACSAEPRQQIATQKVGRQPYFRDWKWEVLSVLISFALVVGILVTLKEYDGNEQPVWPYNININSLISVFTAVITAQLGVTISAIISQLKWSWFRRPHPLRDLDHYDAASRGIWGSFNFLGRFITQPGAYLAMGAALLFLVSAAIGPFAQQSIKTYACQRSLHNISASIPAATFINSSLDVSASNPFNRLPNLPMMIAILEGVISTSDNSTQVPFDCPTGNCDFDPYSSLAYCSSCEDITSSVQQHYGESVLDPGEFLWNYTLPGQQCQLSYRDLRGHPRLGTQGATSGSPQHLITCLGSTDFRHKSAVNYTILSMSWANCTDNSADGDPDNASCVRHPEQLPSLADTAGLVAMNCTLNLCVRDYVARVRNGLLDEDTTGMLAASLLPNDESSAFKLLPLPCALDGQLYYPANISEVPMIPGRNFTSVILEDGRNVTAPIECVFTVDESVPWAVNQFLDEEVFSALDNADSSATCSKNSIGGSSSCDPWYLAPVFNNGRATAESITAVMRSIATSVSSRMRVTGSNAYANKTGEASGTVISSTVCLRIEWPWLILPIALVVLTMALFAAVLIIARHFLVAEGMPIWKSSTLVPFFHGIVADQSNDNAACPSSNLIGGELTEHQLSSLLGHRRGRNALLRLDHITSEAAQVVVKLETKTVEGRGFVVVEQEGHRTPTAAAKRRFFGRSARKAEACPLNQEKGMVENAPTLPDVELGSQLVSSIRESLRSSHQQQRLGGDTM